MQQTCRSFLGPWMLGVATAVTLAGATAWAGDAPAVAPPAAPQTRQGGLSPAESLAKFVHPKELQVEQLLAEPVVARPLFLNFDERGRMWVVEYRQYPSPAGLTVVSHDKFWRAVYDKVPAPPPHHVHGQDRITIHEDTQGDGVFHRHKTFLDGLNIATAVVRGRGGVWVLNPPYLLFYRDRDNDVPEGDPEVHLEGFGLEDTHSVVNSLCWGPDGWLYGAHGSTVTGHVRRPGRDKQPVITMGQLIWRYHPETRRYEVFAEGGGNTFGVEFDRKGRLYSGHNGGDTRGFHYVQGGYYLRNFDKHGGSSNPYAFGNLPAMRHAKAPRFTHTFVLYEGAALGDAYRNKLFAVNPLLGQVIISDVTRDGSSFRTKDVGQALASSDSWFRPVDIKVGPDGALYVADWYDGQIAHYRNQEGQIDPDNGRIYRLRAKGAGPFKPPDLGKYSTAELVKLLGQENRWMRETALRLLGDRKDRTVIPLLRRMLREGEGQLALEALWALNLSGGLDETQALQALGHADAYVRLWTVRLLGDQRQVSATVAGKLADMAKSEPHVEVRSQLACSARRLPARDALPIVRGLLAHDEDDADVHLPLLLWWALEAKAESDREAVLALFKDPAVWRLPLVEKHILNRLMRRYAQAGRQQDLLTCAVLLRTAPEPGQAGQLLAGFETAFAGRPVANLPPELVEALASRGGGSLALRLRQGNAEAVGRALRVIVDDGAAKKQRLELIQIFGEIQQPKCVPLLLRLVAQSREDELRRAALMALQPYPDPAIGAEVVRLHNDLSADVRAAAQTLLVSRATWTRQLLRAVDAGKIDPTAVPQDLLRKMLLRRDETVATLIRKHWGEVRGATTAEMRRQIDRLAVVVRSDKGDPYAGIKLFTLHCAKCHQLFGKGGDIGPDLTSYNRQDVDTLLLNIVNPSAEIREGFETHFVAMDDGRSLTGFLVEKNDKIVALRGADGQTVVLPRSKIEEMQVVPQSLMPEGLLKDLGDQQVRDLFAYLRSAQPLNVKE